VIAHRVALGLGVLIWLAAFAGCSITRPAVERHVFTLETGRSVPVATVRIPATLKVGRISMQPPYGGTTFLYRTGALQYEADPYNGFFAAPNELLGHAIAQWLAQSQLFAAVREPASPLTGDNVLEGLVTELYGDLRDPQDPAAVLAIQIYVRRGDAQGALVFDHAYSQRVRTGSDAAEALARGFGTALGQVLGKLEHDLAVALAK
jgi:cholesterol transport system auxiliary component